MVASLNVWVLEFHSPRCGTCVELAPLYAQLAQTFSSVLYFGAVDIDTDSGNELATSLGVLASDGVPAIRVYTTVAARDSRSLFSGWEIPSMKTLERQLTELLERAEVSNDGAENQRFMKA